jgi:hypothetical protein
MSFSGSYRFQNQLCSPPAVLLWSWVFTLLDYWGLVSLPCPLTLDKVCDPSDGPLLSDGLLIIFDFAVSFDFGCCLLAQETSFVDCYLPYFRQQLITCLLSAILSFQPLFTESSWIYLLLVPPHFSGAFSATLHL